MLFKWLSGLVGGDGEERGRASASAELWELVRATVPGASEAEAGIVASVAGLLAFVAYADRRYDDAERVAVREALSRVEGLPGHAGEAVSALLDARIVELANESLPTYTRVLYELTDRTARLELFEVLMDIAVSDHVLTMDETNGLRRIANLLGLSEQDYLASQGRHKDRLSVLQSD